MRRTIEHTMGMHGLPVLLNVIQSELGARSKAKAEFTVSELAIIQIPINRKGAQRASPSGVQRTRSDEQSLRISFAPE